MDSAKKAELEKRIVLGLAAVCGVVFIAGPMRSLNLFPSGGPAVQPNENVNRVKLTKPVGGIIQEGWEKLDREVESSTTRPSVPQPVAAYTAFDVRDPLKSLLPKPVPSMSAGSELAAERASTEAFSSPPLQLHVEGLLWGGAEPKAIINGRLYGVHDDVNGGKIVAIDRTGVTVERFGKPVVYSTASTR